MRPIVLEPNMPDTFYRGAGRIARFRGDAAASQTRPEDWIASTTPRFGRATDGMTRLADGSLLADLIAADPVAWLGKEHVARYGADPALLVKLLDAGERLPVHVHPDRAFAATHLASPYGKTEAWIVVEAEPGAVVYLGFARDVGAAELAGWVSRQDTGSMLAATNRVPVSAGDTVLCPAGTPHAIGAGVLIVELQEPTDLSVILEWRVFSLGPDDAKQPDHVAVAKVEFHRLIIWPFKPVHAKVGPQQPPGGGQAFGVRDGEHEQHRIHQEDQLAAGAQQPGRLGNPRVGIAPDAGAVLRDRQVEAAVGEGCLLGAGVDEREPQSETVLQVAGGDQLRRGVVQPGRARAAAGQPRRHVPGAAAQLDAVPARQVGGQHAHLGLRDVPDAPGPVPATAASMVPVCHAVN